LQWAALLGWLERSAYDARVKHCLGKRSPTTRFVHLDIDDSSIEALGPWPWPRSVMAEAIRELADAGARVIALDVLYPERASSPSAESQAVEQAMVRDTQRLSEAMEYARAGKVAVVMPVSYSWDYGTGDDQVWRAAMGAYRQALKSQTRDLEPEELTERIRPTSKVTKAELDRVVTEDFWNLRRDVLLAEALDRASPNLIPPDLKLKAESLHELWKMFDVARQPERELMEVMREQVPPLSLLRPAKPPTDTNASREHVRGYGFVSYVPDADGTVRSSVLLAHDRDKLAPQFALAVAMLGLGVDPAQLRIEDDRLQLGESGRSIPVHTALLKRGGKPSEGNMLVPWPAPAEPDWRKMMGADVPHIGFFELIKVAREGHEIISALNALRREESP
jgi:hypothetical protein